MLVRLLIGALYLDFGDKGKKTAFCLSKIKIKLAEKNEIILKNLRFHVNLKNFIKLEKCLFLFPFIIFSIISLLLIQKQTLAVKKIKIHN